jgi:hypothetical protein
MVISLKTLLFGGKRYIYMIYLYAALTCGVSAGETDARHVSGATSQHAV